MTILSVTPPKQYEACPYCFANLEPEPPIEEEDVAEPTVEQKEAMKEEEATPTIKSGNSVLEKVMDSAPGFLQKFKELIPTSNGSQKEKREKQEKPRAEPVTRKEENPTKKEPKTEPVTKEEEPKEETKTETLDKEETKETFRTEQSTKEESEPSGCPEHFGYLANRPPDAPIPPQCLVCPKMVDCALSPKES